MSSTPLPKTPAVYAIINAANHHCYVGSTANLYERCYEHFRHLRKGDHTNAHLQYAYNLYGSSVFVFVVLEHASRIDDLLVKEQHYIDLLKPEYNIALFAGAPTRGRKLSPEAIARGVITRKARREQDPEYGRWHPDEETRARYRAMYTGKKLPPRSPEWIEKNAAANRGRKHRPESLEKMSAAKRGKKQLPEHVERRISGIRGKPWSAERHAKVQAIWAAKRAAKLAEQQLNQPPLF
jgi:group I intron endonuclease